MFPGNSLKIQPQQAYTLCCGVFVYREGVQARFQAGDIMNNVFEKMRRNRIGTVIGSILLVAVLFFGCAYREISRDRDAIICALDNEFGPDTYILAPENYFSLLIFNMSLPYMRIRRCLLPYGAAIPEGGRRRPFTVAYR